MIEVGDITRIDKTLFVPNASQKQKQTADWIDYTYGTQLYQAERPSSNQFLAGRILRISNEIWLFEQPEQGSRVVWLVEKGLSSQFYDLDDRFMQNDGTIKILWRKIMDLRNKGLI